MKNKTIKLLALAMIIGIFTQTSNANSFGSSFKSNLKNNINTSVAKGVKSLSIQKPKQDYGKLPTTYAEWKERIPEMLNTPEGAVKMYFDGVYAYMNPKTRTEGQKMLRYILRLEADWDKRSSMQTFVSRMKDPDQQYIFRSFAKGTSPSNGYAMNPDTYELMFSSKTKETDYTRVMIKSSGADSTKGAWVKQFPDGNWHVINNANLYGNVRKPTNIVDNSFDADFD